MAFWKKRSDGSFEPAEGDGKNLSDIEFKPEQLESKITENFNSALQKFREEQAAANKLLMAIQGAEAGNHVDLLAERGDVIGGRKNAAGENLALAPTLQLAHDGLMKSPGHRANILSTNYRTVGIGIVDGGPYGLMVTQDFTD